MTTVRTWDLSISHRIEGEPWKVRFIEVKGAGEEPATAFVAGIYGDEAAGSLMMHELVRRLAEVDVRGTIIVVPAANPPALALGAKLNPDGLQLNRRFPGSATGFLTDQLAHHVFNAVKERADCVVDFHTAQPYFGVWFVYDHNNTALAASFGVPVAQNFKREGMLAVAAARAGMKACLAELARNDGSGGDIPEAVEACLNMLRYRGHLEGALSGPSRVALMPDISLFMSSVPGVFVGRYGVHDIGKAIEPGLLGWIANVATGERMEEFVLKARGTLLLANVSPYIMTPNFAPTYMIGFPKGEAERQPTGSR